MHTLLKEKTNFSTFCGKMDEIDVSTIPIMEVIEMVRITMDCEELGTTYYVDLRPWLSPIYEAIYDLQVQLEQNGQTMLSWALVVPCLVLFPLNYILNRIQATVAECKLCHMAGYDLNDKDYTIKELIDIGVKTYRTIKIEKL